MSTNETLIQVPVDVADPTQLRQFLVKLIVTLDGVLGLRDSQLKLDNQVDLLPELDSPADPDAIDNRNKINELINSLNEIGVL